MSDLQVGGYGWGQLPHPVQNFQVTETASGLMSHGNEKPISKTGTIPLQILLQQKFKLSKKEIWLSITPNLLVQNQRFVLTKMRLQGVVIDDFDARKRYTSQQYNYYHKNHTTQPFILRYSCLHHADQTQSQRDNLSTGKMYNTCTYLVQNGIYIESYLALKVG